MNTSTSTLKLMTIVDKRTQSQYQYEVIAMNAYRAKMLICLKNDKIRVSELKVVRSINLDNRVERVLTG